MNLGASEQGVTIATLNYDLSIERQAEHLGVSCDTGVQSWLDDGELLWASGEVQLLKLHGSIGWLFFDKAEQSGQLRESVFAVADANVQGSRPAVVFGQREKLRV